MKVSLDKIALGITDHEVPLGTHLVQFWLTDAQFQHGVRSLEFGIADESLGAILSHSWPGSVRELQNLIERAVIRSDNGVLPNPLPSRRRGG